jgi:Family of unknown function (DUF5808)/Protein of unknown function (DUF1648)
MTAARREPYPWAWTVPALLVIAGTAALGALRYPGLPDRIAAHFDVTGTVDRTVPSTVPYAFTPVFMQVGMTVVLSASAIAATALMARALLFMTAFIDLGLYFIAARIWHGGNLGPGTAAATAAAVVVGVLGVVGTGAYARQTGPRPPAAGDDPALLVPRRSGLGLTVNFGHPRGWVVLAALIALLVISAAAGVLAS